MIIHITNNDYSLISRFYSIGKNNYEIIGTKSTGYKANECIDTIRNLATLKIKEVKRTVLHNFTR